MLVSHGKVLGRSPHGERGLKYRQNGGGDAATPSLPTRGAWIEIILVSLDDEVVECRSPHGERGLKYVMLDTAHHYSAPSARRSPHGERGLKYVAVVDQLECHVSLPTRGAWIEIQTAEKRHQRSKSLPTRGAWIEMEKMKQRNMQWRSLPTRGAWIEITILFRALTTSEVAPHTGSVD